MKSIRAKFILLIMSSLMICIATLGGAGIITTKKTIDSYSAEYMNLECTNIAEELNGTLGNIEQSVKTLADYAVMRISNTDALISDEKYFEQYVSEIENIAMNAAVHTEGAVAVYLRLNPEHWGTKAGFFLTKSHGDGTMHEAEITDLDAYSSDNINRVGWYYLPVNAGEALWLEPYLNENINVYMISYVIPIYSDNTLVGVIGMDIDFSVFTNYVADKTVYESGYAFLISHDAHTLYHHTAPEGVSLGTAGDSLEEVAHRLGERTSGCSLIEYNSGKEQRKMSFHSLRNNIYVALTAPENEINSTRNRLIVIIIAAGFSFLTIALILTIIITRRITKPILELNGAAQKLVEGNLDVEITSDSKDEVGTLIDSFRKTVQHLKEYIGYINGLAYIDNMTGVKNKTAYAEAVTKLEERAKTDETSFGVVVFDINDLKYINDNYGHEAGDRLIIGSCRVICKTFSHSPVYRIGGDEFVAILQNEDLENADELVKELERNISKANDEINDCFSISVACGYAAFEHENDKCYSDVFNRADEAMYRNKADIKKARNNTKTKQ